MNKLEQHWDMSSGSTWISCKFWWVLWPWGCQWGWWFRLVRVWVVIQVSARSYACGCVQGCDAGWELRADGVCHLHLFSGTGSRKSMELLKGMFRRAHAPLLIPPKWGRWNSMGAGKLYFCGYILRSSFCSFSKGFLMYINALGNKVKYLYLFWDFCPFVYVRN